MFEGNFLGIFELFWRICMGEIFWRNFLGRFFGEDDLFVKILSQSKKEGRKCQSLEVRVQAYCT